LGEGFFARSALEVAPELLNKVLVAADGRAGRIVEVEAYGQGEDPASHAHRGLRERNRSMFGPPGRLYVYRSYGVHCCANLVAHLPGKAGAVLLRALEPERGLEAMQAARRGRPKLADKLLCLGPGRLTVAMGIGLEHDGVGVCGRLSPFWVEYDGVDPPSEAVRTPRVGISRGCDLPWRFLVPSSARRL